jgi:signal peptidase
MKLLGKISYGIFIALLVGVASLLLVSLVPITGNVEIKIVKSGSMAPAIPTGSIVLVMPSADIKAGDIITFGRDTKRDIPTTHRVLSVKVENGQTLFTTKGDANEEQDPSSVPLRDVIGKVFLHVPGAGYVLDFARQPIGFALLIGLPAMMIVIDESTSIFREVMALRRRKNRVPLVHMPVPQKPHQPTVFREKIPTI